MTIPGYCVIATVVYRPLAGRCAGVRGRDARLRGARRSAEGQWQAVHRAFRQPRPAEVLFERICRENGITQRLTKPRSPTTTGKIERLQCATMRAVVSPA